MVKVVLSYGHGENTFPQTGSKGVIINGVRYAEHTHNCEIGVRVNNILVAHGVQTLVVQPPHGTDVPLATRTNKANNWGADLYWSIHSNAGEASARGWCAFYWKGSAQGERLAKLYAKQVQALGLPLYSGDGIYPSEKGTWSDFHELRETHMIAVLTENGFMTNTEDFKYIFQNLNGHYDKLARAHAKAILEYFGIAYEPVKSGEVKPVERKWINILTGGYCGDALKEVHAFITSRQWHFDVSKNNDGTLSFLVGGFIEDGSDGAKEFKEYLEAHNWWYQVKEV